MTDEQEQGPLRRLLQHLEQRVGARPIKLVDRIHDGDAPTALSGCRADKRHRAAYFVHRDLLTQHAFLVGCALEDEEIALPSRGDAARHWIFSINRKRFSLLHRGGRWIGMCEHKTSNAVSERRLADALGSDDEKRVRHAGASVGSKKCRLSTGMTKQVRGRARMGRLGGCFLAGLGAHALSSTNPISSLWPGGRRDRVWTRQRTRFLWRSF